MGLKYVVLYILTVPVFLLVDLFWIGIIAKDFYTKEMKEILTRKMNWAAAIAFYMIFVFGVILFAVKPGLETENGRKALGLAAIFGFIAYSTYDLTNLALLKNWSKKMVLVDLIWGTALSSAVAIASYYIGKALGL